MGNQVRLRLPRDAELHCTSRFDSASDNEVTWHRIDLRDPTACETLIRTVRPDTLIHCAWNTTHGSFWEAGDNARWLEAGRTLFSTFAECGGRRIVGCGTCAEYSREKGEPHREDEAIEPIAPASRYGRAKLSLLRHLESLDISHAWARMFLIYGEGEHSARLVPSILQALLSGKPAQCSSGTQLRDFSDVRNVGEAIAMLAFSEVEGVVNLGSGEAIRLGEVAQMLGEMTGGHNLVRLGALPDRPGEAAVLVPDVRRQVDELGFIPRIRLKQGLQDAVQYWATRN